MSLRQSRTSSRQSK